MLVAKASKCVCVCVHCKGQNIIHKTSDVMVKKWHVCHVPQIPSTNTPLPRVAREVSGSAANWNLNKTGGRKWEVPSETTGIIWRVEAIYDFQYVYVYLIKKNQ